MSSLTTKLYIWKVNYAILIIHIKVSKATCAGNLIHHAKYLDFKLNSLIKASDPLCKTLFSLVVQKAYLLLYLALWFPQVCWCKEVAMWHIDTSLYTRRTCMVPLNHIHPHPIIWTASIEKCCWGWSSTVFHCRVKEFSNCRVCFCCGKSGQPRVEI